MLSVIISSSNGERALVATLSALVGGAVSGLVREVMVTVGTSGDATAEVADFAGCTVLAAEGPLGARLKTAAFAARSPWLMFLRAGTVLDPSWLDETAGFIREADRAGDADDAAVFRRSVSVQSAYPALREGLGLIGFGLFGRVHPRQGLVIAARLYRELGGHRSDARDPEADLIHRLGRRRIVMLRSGAR